MAARIPADGRETVSERRSTMATPLLFPTPAVCNKALGNPERQLQGLLDVQPWIAGRLVTTAQVGGGQFGGAADAFGDIVAGQLDVQSAGMGAQRRVHVEEAVYLVDDPVQVPRLG